MKYLLVFCLFILSACAQSTSFDRQGATTKIYSPEMKEKILGINLFMGPVNYNYLGKHKVYEKNDVIFFEGSERNYKGWSRITGWFTELHKDYVKMNVQVYYFKSYPDLYGVGQANFDGNNYSAYQGEIILEYYMEHDTDHWNTKSFNGSALKTNALHYEDLDNFSFRLRRGEFKPYWSKDLQTLKTPYWSIGAPNPEDIIGLKFLKN